VTRFTRAPGHATELAAEAAAESDAVVVFSGDGTYNEAINGVGSVPMGFLPGGGTSVLPRALGIPPDPVAAAGHIADALLAGRSRRISVGRVNGRRFGFSAGIGLDAELVRRVDALGRTLERGRAGNARFAWTALRVLAEHRFTLEPALEVRGHGRAAFALAANGNPYTYAGLLPLHVAPLATFEGGLDLVGARRLTPARLPRFATYVLRGRGQDRARDVLYAHDVDRAEVVCDRPLPLQADGEDLGDVREAMLEAERASVTVFV
jgi:diacylglycerol kinase family enzyme